MAQPCEFTKCPSEMVEMMNFMSMYFSIVKTEGVFYSVLLAKDTSVQPDTSSFFNFLLLYFFPFYFFFSGSGTWSEEDKPGLSPDGRAQLGSPLPEESKAWQLTGKLDAI